jgi:hypothetical protein
MRDNDISGDECMCHLWDNDIYSLKKTLFAKYELTKSVF